MDDPKRARSWKRRRKPWDNLKAVEPVPYSTRIYPKILFKKLSRIFAIGYADFFLKHAHIISSSNMF